MNIARCIGCGCTDLAACPGGCSWLVVDRARRTGGATTAKSSGALGVCSECPEALKRWRVGDMRQFARVPARRLRR